MVKIVDILLELKNYIKVADSDIIKANKSKINDTNHPEFKKLSRAWESGKFDEKMETLYFMVAGLLDKEKIK